MTGLRTLVAAAALLIATMAPVAALAQTPASGRTAADLIQSGNAEQAYALLSPQAVERAGDPEFDYLLGLSALDTGRVAEAIVALQRVLAVQPANAQARAELARAYALAGDADTARREFDTIVADPTLPDPVRQRFYGIMRDMDRQMAGGGSSLTGFLEAGAGHDSNINTATASSSLVIPLFAALGPAALSGGASAQDDGFWRAEGGVSLLHGLSRQTRVFASGLASIKDNIDDDAFDQSVVTGTAGVGHTFASRQVLSGTVQAQRFWLSGSGYRNSVGAIVQLTTPVRGGAAVSVAAQVFDLDYVGDPLRDARRSSIGVSYAGRSGIVSGQFGQEETDGSAADHFSHRFAALSAAFQHPLSPAIALEANVGAEIRDYQAADPLFLTTREDRQWDVGVGLRVQVTPNLSLRPRVAYSRNDSNIALYQYDRVTASISLRTEF